MHAPASVSHGIDAMLGILQVQLATLPRCSLASYTRGMASLNTSAIQTLSFQPSTSTPETSGAAPCRAGGIATSVVHSTCSCSLSQ